MEFIQGSNRQQSYFSSLEEQVSSANAVRLRVYTAMGKNGRGMEIADTSLAIEGIEENGNGYDTQP